jgi:hypothetical protein
MYKKMAIVNLANHNDANPLDDIQIISLLLIGQL